MMLKESLVRINFLTLLLLYSISSFSQTNKEEEKSIIELLSIVEKIQFITDVRLDWKRWGFTNYQKLNHENIVNFERGDFELDLWFDAFISKFPDQNKRIEVHQKVENENNGYYDSEGKPC